VVLSAPRVLCVTCWKTAVPTVATSAIIPAIQLIGIKLPGGGVRAWTAPTVNTARGPCTVTIDVCRVAYSISQPIPGLPIVR